MAITVNGQPLENKIISDNITCAVKSMGDFMTNDHCQRAVVDISGREALGGQATLLSVVM